MQLKKSQVQMCCGQTANVWTLSVPVSLSLIEFLKQHGFSELGHFTSSGILYMESPDLLVTGPIGNNSLTIKCKVQNCDHPMLQLENILSLV